MTPAETVPAIFLAGFILIFGLALLVPAFRDLHDHDKRTDDDDNTL